MRISIQNIRTTTYPLQDFILLYYIYGMDFSKESFFFFSYESNKTGI